MGMMVGANGAVIRTADPYGTQKKNTREVQTTKNKKKKYKKLNYNYREVSGRILRAKTSISARQAAVHARTVVAMLRRRYGCGEYNDRELEIAIVHAEKMVRIAKKKLKNLRMEELARRTSEAEKIREEREGGEKEKESGERDEVQSESGEMSEEELRKMIQRMERELQELAAQNDLDELTDECLGGGKMSEEELKQVRKKHRCDEMRKIVEADMKYLKAMFQRMMQEQQETTSAAILELSGAAAVNASAPVSLASGGNAAATEGAGVDTSV